MSAFLLLVSRCVAGRFLGRRMRPRQKRAQCRSRAKNHPQRQAEAACASFCAFANFRCVQLCFHRIPRAPSWGVLLEKKYTSGERPRLLGHGWFSGGANAYLRPEPRRGSAPQAIPAARPPRCAQLATLPIRPVKHNASQPSIIATIFGARYNPKSGSTRPRIQR